MSKHRRRGCPSIILLVIFGLGVAGVASFKAFSAPDVRRLPEQTDTSILQMLDHVKTIPTRPNPDGYDRDCGPGDGCVFGRAWTDVDHNGCDTRSDILGKQLTEIVFKPGTRQCQVKSGTLRDPYTGALLHYPGDSVQIDHIYPLALAWDMGAASWDPERRTGFANDPANLLAVDGPTNMSKGDSSPAEWAPINPTFRCDYVKRFLTVAVGYGLPITKADADSIRHTATKCT
jgi:hypothetical protein